MFKHTMASVNIIKSEVSLLSYIANIISALFMIAYLIFASVGGKGFLAVNIVLCVLTATNFVIYLVTRKRNDKESKSIRKLSRHFYNISRIILNAIPLGTVLYLLAFTSEEISRIEMVFLPLLILVWLSQVVLEILSLYIQSRFTLFVNGIEMDIENVIRPILKVKNVLSGTHSEPQLDNGRISEHNRAVLSEKAEEQRKAKEQDTPKNELFEKLTKTKDAIKEFIKR